MSLTLLFAIYQFNAIFGLDQIIFSCANPNVHLTCTIYYALKTKILGLPFSAIFFNFIFIFTSNFKNAFSILLLCSFKVKLNLQQIVCFSKKIRTVLYYVLLFNNNIIAQIGDFAYSHKFSMEIYWKQGTRNA